VHVGLGTIGLACLRVAAERPGVEVVAAVDAAPALVGQDAGELAGLGRPLGVAVAGDWGNVPPAEVAVVCTTSRLADLRPVVATAFERGLDVVSTCEPLAGPAADDPDAVALDVLARRWHRRLLGVGVNPGFVMDALPLHLTAAQSRVDAVRVRRVVDASTRRPQLAAKVGAGLTPREFAAGVRRGELGHVGLPASARLIAGGLGWEIDELRETIRPVTGADGRCTGARQRLRASERGEVRIFLDLTIAVGARPSGDTILLDGSPPLRWATRPATAGDEATAALTVNAALAVGGLPAGLRTMVDLVSLRYRTGDAAATLE
jgi:4-hydroxy-tetrahydrodipicolinate reductase